MTNKERETVIKEALTGQDLFVLRSVDQINHKPHPYTIGPKHVAYASDHYMGMLGLETLKAVKCAWPNCNLSYEDHKSDTVAFLSQLRNGTNDEANTILKALVDKIGENLVDGFTFVDTPEKFRIK